jgi:hypothetical protein
MTDSGIIKVIFEEFSPEQQEKFNFDPAKAIEWKDRQAEALRQAQRSRKLRGRPRTSARQLSPSAIRRKQNVGACDVASRRGR